MDSAEISVLVGGVAAMVGVLWFFFGARGKYNRAPSERPNLRVPDASMDHERRRGG